MEINFDELKLPCVKSGRIVPDSTAVLWKAKLLISFF
jgi:hypothetical protein